MGHVGKFVSKMFAKWVQTPCCPRCLLEGIPLAIVVR